MTTFDKREEGFEQQFAHDEELRFKATARRNKLLGLWAAEKLGLQRRRSGELCQIHGHERLREPARMTYWAKSTRISPPRASCNPIIRSAGIMTELMEKAIADIKAGK